MIQDIRYAYSVKCYTLMNIVVTEIYGDRKQTDWQGKMFAVIVGPSHFFFVQRSDETCVRTSRHVSHHSVTAERESLSERSFINISIMRPVTAVNFRRPLDVLI